MAIAPWGQSSAVQLAPCLAEQSTGPARAAVDLNKLQAVPTRSLEATFGSQWASSEPLQKGVGGALSLWLFMGIFRLADRLARIFQANADAGAWLVRLGTRHRISAIVCRIEGGGPMVARQADPAKGSR